MGLKFDTNYRKEILAFNKQSKKSLLSIPSHVQRPGHPIPAHLLSSMPAHKMASDIFQDDLENVTESSVPDRNLWSDFDYQNIANIVKLSEVYISELHREYLILASSRPHPQISYINENNENTDSSYNSGIRINLAQFSALFMQRFTTQNNKTNMITNDAATKAALGRRKSEAQEFCRDLFSRFDLDHNGLINFCEFVCAFVHIKDQIPQEEKEIRIEQLLKMYNSCECINYKDEAASLANILLLQKIQPKNVNTRPYQTASF